MADGHYNVLFLSHRNSARSIFAEAALNRMGHGHFTGFSAGLRPVSHLDELVVDVLRVAEYRTEGLYPKHWKEFAKADSPPLDFVFTLCDLEAGEPQPNWPGRPVTGDWRYPDPVKLSDPAERRSSLAATLGGLERQLLAFMQLPFRSLDEISLRERLKGLARVSIPLHRTRISPDVVNRSTSELSQGRKSDFSRPASAQLPYRTSRAAARHPH